MIRDEEKKAEKKPHNWLFLFLSFSWTVLGWQSGEGRCKILGLDGRESSGQLWHLQGKREEGRREGKGEKWKAATAGKKASMSNVRACVNGSGCTVNKLCVLVWWVNLHLVDSAASHCTWPLWRVFHKTPFCKTQLIISNLPSFPAIFHLLLRRFPSPIPIITQRLIQKTEIRVWACVCVCACAHVFLFPKC